MILLLCFLSAPEIFAQGKDRPHKGDITGRKFRTKTSPRPQWGSRTARPDPYAGKRRRSEASRSKANKQAPGYSSRERSARYKRWDNSSMSITRDRERSKKIKRIRPRSASGAYRVRKRKNPYVFRERSRWEDAYQGDITGRTFRTKRTTGRPDIKEPPKVNYTQSGRKGDRAYKGKINAGINSISRTKERAGQSGGAANRRSVRTSFTGKNKSFRGGGLSISRDPERKRRIKRITPRSASGAYNVRKRKNPYNAFRKRTPWEKAFQGDITGRTFKSKRTTDRPELQRPPQTRFSSKGRRGDKPYNGRVQTSFKSISRTKERAWQNDISGNKLRIRTSEKPKLSGQVDVYPKGKRRGDQAYRGKIKGRDFKSVTSRKERAGKRIGSSRPPGEGTKRAWDFQGNIKSPRKQKGGGSISDKLRNNNGRAIKGSGKQDNRIAGFQGNIKGGKILKGGGTVKRNNWNNNGRPVAGEGPKMQDNSIARFQGNVKGRKILKGGGSIDRKNWNNNGQPIAGRGRNAQDNGIARFQGNIKGGKVLKGGGSVDRKNWNNNGQPIPGRSLTAQDGRVAKFQGNTKKRPAVQKDAQGSEYAGKIPAYMLQKGPDDAVRFTGGIKRRRNYVKNPNAVKESLKVKALVGTDRKSGNYRGNIRPYLLEKGPHKRHKYTGHIKRSKYKHNPIAADEALKVKKPGKNDRLAADFQGFTKKGPDYRKNKMAAAGSLKNRYPGKGYFEGGAYKGDIKSTIKYKQNPKSADESLKNRPPAQASVKGLRFQGRVKVTSSYRKTPNSADGALKGIGPSKAAVKASSFQGNLKVHKKRIEDRHPDFKYISKKSNGKAEKEKFFSFKLFWSKLFRRNENQPENLKEKERKPRYDSSEQDLWND